MTGVMKTSDGSFVIINGKMLAENRIIDDVRILRIGASTVLVEFNGERRTLYVNE